MRQTGTAGPTPQRATGTEPDSERDGARDGERDGARDGERDGARLAEAELAAQARALVAEVAASPWGEVAPSLYDTSRLVALAPWLPGHAARLRYLCQQQHPDGGWGGPEGYALVPTLSATGALLTELRRGPRRDAEALVRAARAGQQALHRWLDAPSGPVVPDTIASELVVPALLEEVNGLTPDGIGLRSPVGFDQRVLDGVRSRFAAGALSPRLTYCLEVLGAAAAGTTLLHPVAGVVGCSPAATAAWAGGPAGPSGHSDSLDYLDALQARHGGLVPVVAPITYFEPAWVLNNLAAGRLSSEPSAELLARLDAGLTTAGAAVAPSLPPDADDTAAVLAALLRHGRLRPPDSLLAFRTDGYFRCFPDERDPSETVNAHVLEALALYLDRRPSERGRFAGPAAMAAGWLRERQHQDGSWWDKWHASPYYATACAVIALRRHGAPESGPAIARAAAWVRETERPGGSWGRWSGTVEETSYAVQILALTSPRVPAPRAADPAPTPHAVAIGRGCAFLADPPPLADHPPLWHGKDLYLPLRVVQSARLAALNLCRGIRPALAGG